LKERDYMIKPTFQTEWVEKGGLLIVIAFFLGGVAGGLYLVSLYLNFYAGMVTSLFLGAFSGLGYLLHLSKPLRFWMVLMRPGTSWMSRGTIALMAFLVFVALQLAPGLPFLSWLPWNASSIILRVLAAVSAVVLIAYKGFALGILNAIPFWNTAMMPVVFIVYAVLGASALSVGMLLLGGGHGILLAQAQTIVAITLVIAAMVVLLYVWISYNSGPSVKYSAVQLLKGHAAPFFVGGVLIAGLALPLVLTAIQMSEIGRAHV
jgi:formate-dependent nitrite reductase membrane component NrfD